MLRRSLRSQRGPAGGVSNNSETGRGEFNSPLPAVGKRRRSLTPPTVPSTPAVPSTRNPESPTSISEALPKPLELSHPRVKRTRKTTWASNNTSIFLPEVVGKQPCSSSHPTAPSFDPTLSTPISEASPKPLEVNHPQVKHTRMTTRASNNTGGALPTVLGKRYRSLNPPTAPSTVYPESSTNISESSTTPPEVVSPPQTKRTRIISSTPISKALQTTLEIPQSQHTGPTSFTVGALSMISPPEEIETVDHAAVPSGELTALHPPSPPSPLLIAQNISTERKEPVTAITSVTSPAESHPVRPNFPQSITLSNAVERESPLPQSDAHSQTIGDNEPVTAIALTTLPTESYPSLPTSIAHSDHAECAEHIDTFTPVASTAGSPLLGLPFLESVVHSQTIGYKEPVAAFAPVVSSTEPHPAGEHIAAIVAVTSTGSHPADQPLPLVYEKSIATIAPIASLSAPPIGQLSLPEPLLPPSTVHSKIMQHQETVAMTIPIAPMSGSQHAGEPVPAIAPVASSTVSGPVDQPLLSLTIPSHVIGQQDAIDTITSPSRSCLEDSCLQPQIAYPRIVEREGFITATVSDPSSAAAHPSDQPLPSSIAHSQTAEYALPEPVALDQSCNSTVTGSDPGSKKRSRSSSSSDNVNLSPTLRPIVPTPRPPAKRTRLEDTEPLPPLPSAMVVPLFNGQRRFGLASRRKIHNRLVTISQEALLAQIKRGQVPATCSLTTDPLFRQNSVEHPTSDDIITSGNKDDLLRNTNANSTTNSGDYQEHSSLGVDETEVNNTNRAISSKGSPPRQDFLPLQSGNASESDPLLSLPPSIPPSQPSIPVVLTASMYPARLLQPDEHPQTSLMTSGLSPPDERQQMSVITIGPSPSNEPFISIALPSPTFSAQPIQSAQYLKDSATTPVDSFPSSQESQETTSSSSVCFIQAAQPAQHFLASSTTAIPSPPIQPAQRLADITTPVDSSPSSRLSIPFTSSSPIPTQSMQPTQHLQASGTAVTITSLSSMHPAQQASTFLFDTNGSHEKRKTNIVKAMETLQKMPDSLEIGIPVNTSSSSLAGDNSEGYNDIYMADNTDGDDIYMADHSNGDDIYTADRSDRDDIFMADQSDHDEDAFQRTSGKHKQKRQSMLVNRDASETYEQLMNNPDAPCNNAAVATVIEMVVDLQADLKTVLRSATSHMNTSQPSNSAGKSRRGKPPPKMTFEVRHQDKANLDLQYDVRMLARELLNLPEVPLRVPSVQELRLFAKNDPGAIGPQIQNYILDLDSTGLASPWNKRATSIFSAEFLTREEFACRDRDAIEHAFKTHLKALQTQYKRQVGPATMDEAERIAKLDNMKKSVCYARRTYKRHRRCNSMNRFAHIPGVDKIMEELQQLPVDAMSGDETEYDDEGKPYLVKTQCEWHDKEADNLFEICDSLDLSTRFDSDDRPGRGRFPDTRTSSNRPDTRHAPPRLPKNLYNATYKDDLTTDEEMKLAMRPAFKFLIPAELLRIAEKYRGAKSRKIAPLPSNHPRLALYTKDGTSLL